jgi:hypothetical protein
MVIDSALSIPCDASAILEQRVEGIPVALLVFVLFLDADKQLRCAICRSGGPLDFHAILPYFFNISRRNFSYYSYRSVVLDSVELC